jgi:hypothetical protein
MSAEDVNRVFAKLDKLDIGQAARNALYAEIKGQHESAERNLEQAYLELEKFRQRIKLFGKEDLNSDEEQRYHFLPDLILALEDEIARLAERATRLQGG